METNDIKNPKPQWKATAQSVKEDWQQGFKLSAIGCAMGVLLNCLAGALYVFNILSSVLDLFT